MQILVALVGPVLLGACILGGGALVAVLARRAARTGVYRDEVLAIYSGFAVLAVTLGLLAGVVAASRAAGL